MTTSDYVLAFLAMILTAVILYRIVGVIHNAMACQFACGRNFLAYGYSYIALVAAATIGLISLITSSEDMLKLAVWLFLFASAGQLLFDRRIR